jgi:hypothetical protein
MKKAGGNVPLAFFVQSFDTGCRAAVSVISLRDCAKQVIEQEYIRPATQMATRG